MSTLIKIIVSTVLSFMLLSCNLDISPGERGNGHVTTETRPSNAAFSTIKAAEGLDVYLTQSDEASITVETDENLQELILTEIKDGVLNIHTKKNIGNSTSKKVRVHFKNISEIISSSGSDVYSTNTIRAESLKLKSSSGSDMELEVNTQALHCKSSSGSDLKLSGKTVNLLAEASSGSAIKAADLFAEAAEAKASSGSDITVNTSKSLIAKASSGGDVNYFGNPEKVEKSNNPSGSIKQK
ncbi:head GIN domain-containing protein [Pseudotamlana agarivorans]|uniref:head GIN domain-containing protein n=1 Tax=Pseudotamlana agarivorans TaxID=481183 RepID=UPI000829E268|nr:head GIN domain-containing protein [Tamlana agarivorans]